MRHGCTIDIIDPRKEFDLYHGFVGGFDSYVAKGWFMYWASRVAFIVVTNVVTKGEADGPSTFDEDGVDGAS